MAKRQAKRGAILQGSKRGRSTKHAFGVNTTRTSAAGRPTRSATKGASRRRIPPSLSEKLPFRN